MSHVWWRDDMSCITISDGDPGSASLPLRTWTMQPWEPGHYSPFLPSLPSATVNSEHYQMTGHSVTTYSPLLTRRRKKILTSFVVSFIFPPSFILSQTFHLPKWSLASLSYHLDKMWALKEYLENIDSITSQALCSWFKVKLEIVARQALQH